MLPLRKRVVEILRECEADIVLTHRPNDYHPDHRYTSVVVQDAAFMVTVPHFCPSVPALRKNPVFLYLMDSFQKPTPFHPDIAVDVTGAMDTKWSMLDAMESQMYEWLPWLDGSLHAKTRFAELFEVCEYGHQPSDEEIRRLFPFFPEPGARKPRRKG